MKVDYFDLLSFTAHVSCLILLLNAKQATSANLYKEVVWSPLNNYCEDTSEEVFIFLEGGGLEGIQGKVINLSLIHI